MPKTEKSIPAMSDYRLMVSWTCTPLHDSARQCTLVCTLACTGVALACSAVALACSAVALACSAVHWGALPCQRHFEKSGQCYSGARGGSAAFYKLGDALYWVEGGGKYKQWLVHKIKNNEKSHAGTVHACTPEHGARARHATPRHAMPRRFPEALRNLHNDPIDREARSLNRNIGSVAIIHRTRALDNTSNPSTLATQRIEQAQKIVADAKAALALAKAEVIQVNAQQVPASQSPTEEPRASPPPPSPLMGESLPQDAPPASNLTPSQDEQVSTVSPAQVPSPRLTRNRNGLLPPRNPSRMLGPQSARAGPNPRQRLQRGWLRSDVGLELDVNGAPTTAEKAALADPVGFKEAWPAYAALVDELVRRTQ
ncbi:hypothetical protein GGX14DRAFT_391641 [Mycena pura]|uniref:Uncharacterized protein n=1 Tax=Mycena pura TaxID=153505 RepID=A0AAD6VLU9_9AGAR|nr:hypothetical protein GGX14DRAFT_391641 [Mycena pura]